MSQEDREALNILPHLLKGGMPEWIESRKHSWPSPIVDKSMMVGARVLRFARKVQEMKHN